VKRILQQLLIMLMFFSLFLLWPAQAKVIGWIAFCMTLLLSIFVLPAKHYAKFKRGMITRLQVLGNTMWEILGMLLIVAAASWLGGAVAAYASSLAESRWQGMGVLGGFTAILVVCLVLTNGIKWGMEKLGNFLKLA